VTPEERDDAREPEANGAPEAEAGQEPEAEAQEPETVPGEPGEATPEPDEEQEEQEDDAADEEPAEAEEPVADAEEEPAAAEPAGAEERPRKGRKGRDKEGSEEELIPGAHLEPDLVLEEEQRPQSEYGEYGEAEVEATEDEEAADEPGPEAEPVAREPLALAADARYAATGKRKSAVARVILKPGEGVYTINSRHLDEYFPRVRLQRMARQPLEAAGYQNRMDVVARIHGGGVSAQATALRHGVARALVEADPALRGELKRRGYLTRDPRVKERKKAGLKKARKRPQFSKR
jgi:small subunit ribosomal protein S9